MIHWNLFLWLIHRMCLLFGRFDGAYAFCCFNFFFFSTICNDLSASSVSMFSANYVNLKCIFNGWRKCSLHLNVCICAFGDICAIRAVWLFIYKYIYIHLMAVPNGQLHAIWFYRNVFDLLVLVYIFPCFVMLVVILVSDHMSVLRMNVTFVLVNAGLSYRRAGLGSSLLLFIQSFALQVQIFNSGTIE